MMKIPRLRLSVPTALAIWFVALGAVPIRSETGQDAWRRYTRLDAATAAKYSTIPRVVIRAGDSLLLKSAEQELLGGLHGLLGGEIDTATSLSQKPTILIGTLNSMG